MSKSLLVPVILETFALGFIVGIAAFSPPGPVVVYLMQQSLANGFRSGLFVTLSSAIVGSAILLLIMATGFSSLFGLPVFHLYMGLVGGLSLVTLGSLILRNSLMRSPVTETAGTPIPSIHPFMGGLMVNAFNPMVYLWWGVIGIPSLGLAADLSGTYGIYAWSAGILLSLLLWYGGIAFLASRGKRYIPRKAIKGISLASGVFLILFGLYLLTRYGVNL
jgi:threonine/homoserine/homoserine lactone efflux protein